ncbi:hypothetical protein [Pseudomonas huaxiensis]|uniref:hypothetical protein n=1 Tax=Pseudomonas huaxiensis TaxID=2213017 RepID=UPI0013009406|nr:hypothetical protein [Pseudomonas huaxiensis]
MLVSVGRAAGALNGKLLRFFGTPYALPHISLSITVAFTAPGKRVLKIQHRLTLYKLDFTNFGTRQTGIKLADAWRSTA